MIGKIVKNKPFEKNNRLVLFLSLIVVLTSGCKLNNPFTPPLAKGPTLDKPVDGEKIRPGSKIQFRWKLVNRQESYSVQVSKTSNFSLPFVNDSSIASVNYYNCSFLFVEKVKYYWRAKVKTKTYHKWSDWSDIDSFVISTEGNSPPIKPNNPFPDSAATKVSADSLALTWDSGDPNGDTVFYTVYFDTSSSFTSPDTIIKDSSCLTAATISYQLPFNLALATTYYWRVSARDNYDTTSIGDLWFFTTEDTAGGNPPYTPGTPNINTSLCYVDEPLIVTATTTDPENDSILYMFDYGDGTSPHGTPLIASGQTVVDTHIYNIPFNCYGYFYVKVKAKDKGGRQSGWSDSVQVQVKIREGAMFVCFPNEGPIVHISPKGTFLDSIGHQQCSALYPVTISVDQRSGNSPGGDVWAASTINNQGFRFNNHFKDVLFNMVYSSPVVSNISTPCIDKDGNCWFAFAWWKSIVKLSPTGNILKTIPVPVGSGTYPSISSIAYDETRSRIWALEFTLNLYKGGAQPGRLFLYDTNGTLIKASATYDFCGSYLDIDSTTGDCWVANAGFNNVIRASANCDTIEKFLGFNQPVSLSVDNVRRKIWIADRDNHRVVIINFDFGRTMQVIDQYALRSPSGVKVYSPDGSCWVTDSDSSKVMKFNSSGDTLFTRKVSLWGLPGGVAVDYFERE